MINKILEARPYIIAEVGSNFTSLGDCENSIKTAKICGADAVKFQTFDDKDLYGFYKLGQDIRGGLRLDWVPRLSALAEDIGIDFLCTAFSLVSVRAIDPYVRAHKIASTDISDPIMLAAVRTTEKPVIMSCGGATLQDVELALNGSKFIEWKGFSATDVILLYCNSGYPSFRHNLFKLHALKSFGRPVGLSDHSLDIIYPPLSALRHFSAVVIEKHFKLRDDMKTADAPHSLNPQDFKLMVDNLRQPNDALEPTTEEDHMILRNTRRLVATKDIMSGTVLVRGVNYGGYRSYKDGVGISPMHWQTIEEKVCDVDLKAGDLIAYEDLLNGVSMP